MCMISPPSVDASSHRLAARTHVERCLHIGLQDSIPVILCQGIQIIKSQKVGRGCIVDENVQLTPVCDGLIDQAPAGGFFGYVRTQNDGFPSMALNPTKSLLCLIFRVPMIDDNSTAACSQLLGNRSDPPLGWNP